MNTDDEQSEKNEAVLALLRQQGDALTTVREIDHFAYFPDKDSRARFVAKAEGAGFFLRNLTPPYKKGAKFGAILFHKDIPDEELLEKVTSLLIDLARSCGGEYDGWETQVLE